MKEFEKEKENLILFTKVGAIVLTSLLLLVTSIYFYPQTTATIRSHIDSKELPIYCVESEEPKIALSFDAAWGNEDTAKILEILKKNDVHVTFFMTGGWVEKYPDDVKAIAAAGHDLGNHSENHKQMSTLNAEECKSEILTPHEKVKQLTGVDMQLFRPPYGDYNDNLIQVCREINYYPIQWDVEPYDIVESAGIMYLFSSRLLLHHALLTIKAHTILLDAAISLRTKTSFIVSFLYLFQCLPALLFHSLIRIRHFQF